MDLTVYAFCEDNLESAVKVEPLRELIALLCDELKLPFSSSDYDTIGGYLIGLFDHLPEKNEVITTEENILLQVDQMDKNRISRIYLKLPETTQEE